MTDDSDIPDRSEPADPEWGTTDHAQALMLGNLIDAAKRRFVQLAVPWSQLSQKEQGQLLVNLRADIEKEVRSAVQIIAANARVTFRAEVESVQFKGDGVKAALKLANTTEAHSLADTAGGFVTVVIEQLDELLALPEGALDGEPDQPALFDKSTGDATEQFVDAHAGAAG